ncbi:hypothetical protein I302_101957 [Kwoniella bestiolae CBS 10118]|uniref:BTB domain-containing protein n=1 Tax=Kwoniella bestiolae CBS 10118 TaxID=1296100 RepID=A0A1B9GDR6_9TREE|nr:hypothetical protein I302_00641 [Kwoniella bestiolae CBS 10118]OCF29146.1 hypothetical protein I302_00641 [Kwoniella bestiolae CBS 10118]
MSASINGNEIPENAGESSKAAVGVDPVTYNHSMNLTNWIFNVGYLHQDWADVHVTFFQSGLKAHRVVLARSPYLAHLLRNVIPGSTIHLNFVDENINQESVHIALQHLYNPSHNLINPSNARSLLAISYLFGGMPELTHHSYETIKSSINPQNIVDLVQWVSQSQEFPSNGFGNGVPNGNGNGNVMFGGENGSWEGSEGRYGEWSGRLKNDIINYLLHTLPSSIPTPEITSNPDLISIFSNLPYDLLKLVLEFKEFPFASMQERFSYTKKIISSRKKRINSSSASTPGPGMEESVVLAFKGSDQGMEIHISRKPRKSRHLWKVEG